MTPQRRGQTRRSYTPDSEYIDRRSSYDAESPRQHFERESPRQQYERDSPRQQYERESPGHQYYEVGLIIVLYIPQVFLTLLVILKVKDCLYKKF